MAEGVQPVKKKCPAHLKHRLKLHAGLKKVESHPDAQVEKKKLWPGSIPACQKSTCGWGKQDVKQVLMFLPRDGGSPRGGGDQRL